MVKISTINIFYCQFLVKFSVLCLSSEVILTNIDYYRTKRISQYYTFRSFSKIKYNWEVIFLDKIKEFWEKKVCDEMSEL